MTASNVHSIGNRIISRLAPGFHHARKKKRMHGFFSQFIQPGDLCFDIGAHQGTYTEAFLMLQARVVAIEPVSGNAKTIEVKFSSRPNLTVVKKGLASSSGDGEIRISDRSELSSLSDEFIQCYGSQYHHQWNTSEHIQLITLEELIQQYGVPSFCKIDVEGYELEVLNGLNRVLPFLSFEFNFLLRENARQCVDRLMQLGFKEFNFSQFENFELQYRSWIDGDQLIQAINSWPKTVLTGDIYAKGNRTS